MNLSTKGRYAARIMVYLASNANGRPIQKQSIARAEEISPDYVEQILIKLKTAGLVESHRGAGGGFSLGRSADKISVQDVLEASEGPMAIAPCTKAECKRSSVCVTQFMWKKAGDMLNKLFSETSIGDLAREEVKRGRHLGQHSFDI